MIPTPTTPAAALAEQERVLKPVEQIKAEWEAIEAKRPGGRMDAVLGLLENADRAGKTTAQESRLISVIRTLHDTVGDYHAEMGILLAAHAEALERLERAEALAARMAEMQAAIRNLMNVDARHREFLASPEGFESDDAGFSQFRREFDAAYGRLQALAPAEAPK